mmetsp:Transcript_71314/g.168109  ORF Transcript_71314/g.168109 Transcript_71314/m.168109 type:complete len:101 (+) Transcript_71314:179-481(+)
MNQRITDVESAPRVSIMQSCVELPSSMFDEDKSRHGVFTCVLMRIVCVDPVCVTHVLECRCNLTRFVDFDEDNVVWSVGYVCGHRVHDVSVRVCVFIYID